MEQVVVFFRTLESAFARCWIGMHTHSFTESFSFRNYFFLPTYVQQFSVMSVNFWLRVDDWERMVTNDYTFTKIGYECYQYSFPT